MRFKDLDADFRDAKYKVRMAEKNLNNILEQMIKAGKAAIVPDQDGSWECYIVANPTSLLKDIQYIEFEGEDYRYMGVDEPGRQEAIEQACDPEEFCDEIVLAPGETVEWFIKGKN